MKKIGVLFIFTCICALTNVFSQETERYLEIRGRAELDLQPLNGATVTLYEGNNKVNSARTGADGMFSFKLEVNKYYVVEVGKDKYISKRLAFDTALPETEKGIWVREFAISVVRSCDGVDYAALGNPVDVIKYNNKRKDFESDKDHLTRMRSKLENINYANEECLTNKYKDLVKEADRALEKKSFEEAKELYAAASEISQNQDYPKKKITEINQQISKQENIENLYKNTIGEAEALMAQNKTQEALQKFKAASLLKPQENYPKQKANEIETLLAKDNAAQQAVVAQDTRFNNFITKANAEMAAKNYEAAKQLFQQALQIKPGDASVQGKVIEADRAILAQKQQAEDKTKTADNEKQYQMALAQADNLYKNKDYNKALEAYNKALSLKPNEAYPKQRVNLLNNTIAADEVRKQREIDAGYQNALTAAEKAATTKDFQTAKGYYQQALQFKPDDAALKNKLADMDRQMAQETQTKQQQEELRKQYQALIQKADQFYASKNYDAAKDAYQEARIKRPDEQYPLQRIQEIERQVIAEQAQKQQKIQENYQNAVATGNALLTQKQYQKAKESFQLALTFKPDDVFAKNKIQEADNLMMQEQVQLASLQAKKTEFNKIIANADKLFSSKDFTTAKSEYLRASQILPEEQYPKQRLQEIDRLITLAEAERQRELESKFRSAVNAGNSFLVQKSYNNAKNSFQEALSYKPDDVTIKNKIAEVDNLIRQEQSQQASIQAKKTQYDALVAKADGLFAGKDLAAAKSEYFKASQVLPDEQYPRQRIQEIDRLIAAEAQKQREQDAKYQSAITAANNYFTQKSYSNAKNSYQEALTYRFDDNLAKTRILEIDNIIRQEQAQNAALLAKQKQYDDLIAKADGLFNVKNYPASKDQYRNALMVMSDQSYPKQRMEEIDRLIAEEQRLNAENQAKENSYKLTIQKADALFASKQYEPAKAEYSSALTIKPGELHPTNRMTEIDRLIAQQMDAKAKEASYRQSVAEADKMFEEKKYTESKSAYNKALGFMPAESYPKTQISKIDNILAEAEKLRQQELAKQKQYDNLIAEADKLFNGSSYPQAKESYQKALTIKPDEQYPKARIARIDEIYALVAQQQKKQGTTITAQTPATTAKKAVPAELKFKNDNERDLYLAGLKKQFPEGVTAEIYKEQYKVTSRYVIIRGAEVNELREVHYLTYGGREYSMNGKPITQMYFESQVKQREGEYYKKYEY